MLMATRMLNPEGRQPGAPGQEDGLAIELPPVVGVAGLFPVVGTVPLFVCENRDTRRHKHWRNDQDEDSSAQTLNEPVSGSRGLRIAEGATLSVADGIRGQNKQSGDDRLCVTEKLPYLN